MHVWILNQHNGDPLSMNTLDVFVNEWVAIEYARHNFVELRDFKEIECNGDYSWYSKDNEMHVVNLEKHKVK